MHKMLVIAGAMILAGPAVAAPAPDRSALSYDENATINIACAAAVSQGNDAFQSCVARQVASLKDHPSPDRSGLPASRARAIEKECATLKREGIASYNDCLKQAMAGPQQPGDSTSDDDLAPNYARIFTESATDKPQPTPVAAASLPKPGASLPPRPDHIALRVLAPSELFKQVEGAIFVVLASPSLADARTRNIVQGSAVAISEHLLLTNCHVVRDRPLIKLVQDGRRADATLVAVDNTTDRCVVRAEGITLTPIAGVRPLDSIAVGERVFAIGTPYHMERTLSEGLVSGIRHEPQRNLVQTSAPISPGSSGGGLFDERGNLIGITTLGSAGGAQNLNFAIAAADFWK